jgi:glutamyl-tRNA reductase
MSVAMLGISFHTAPVQLRERAAIPAFEAPAVLRRIRAEFPGSELVLISTCNRTELYTSGIDATADKHRLVQILLKGDESIQAAEVEKHFYLKKDTAAAEHLMSVASGLDAMVVGETEILGQVKQALGIAEENQTVGKRLNALFQSAFRIAKRVFSETDICHGRVSVSSLAAEFAQKVFDNLGSKTVMIVGAGETAELALKSLVDRGARDILVLNRSHERGQALAERYGGRAIQFDLLDDYLSRADIVISSTSAPHFVIHADAVRRASEARRGQPMLMIDIAVPRDIDPASGEVENVYVYSIDDLQRIADENLARRHEAVEHARQIVREGTAEAATLFDTSGLRELMRRFDEHGREVCESALQRVLAREKLATLPEPVRDEIRALAEKIVSKMLAAPRDGLKRAARSPGFEDYARVVTDLYGFDRATGDKPAPPTPDEDSPGKNKNGDNMP